MRCGATHAPKAVRLPGLVPFARLHHPSDNAWSYCSENNQTGREHAGHACRLHAAVTPQEKRFLTLYRYSPPMACSPAIFHMCPTGEGGAGAGGLDLRAGPAPFGNSKIWSLFSSHSTSVATGIAGQASSHAERLERRIRPAICLRPVSLITQPAQRGLRAAERHVFWADPTVKAGPIDGVEHESIVDLAGPRLVPSGAVSDLEVIDLAKVRQSRFG
jgi:hypothetical protein